MGNFTREYCAYLYSQLSAALCMNEERASVQDFRFRCNRNNTNGACQKIWRNWGDRGAFVRRCFFFAKCVPQLAQISKSSALISMISSRSLAQAFVCNNHYCCWQLHVAGDWHRMEILQQSNATISVGWVEVCTKGLSWLAATVGLITNRLIESRVKGRLETFRSVFMVVLLSMCRVE